MRVTQYATGNLQDYKKYNLKPAVFMSGAVSVTPEKEPFSNDFLGFGVAITGSSCYLLNEMPAKTRKEFLNSIYSKDGLGLSVGRITIGSSDYSAELYSYDDVTDDVELKHVSIERDKEYIIPMIKEILAINKDITLFASPWSPPGWMKTGGSMCGGYMREEYIDCYAEYIVRFLKAYEAEGIKIKALTPQNEPNTEQLGRMPTCVWHPDTEARFISILRKKLTENGLDTEIWMFDHSFISAESRVIWQLDTHKHLADECNGIAFHYYDGAIEQTRVLAEKYPNLALHFTEGGPRLYDNYATDWCKWSIMMAKVLGNGYSSFTGWNLMLDESGGPNIGPFSCGGLVTLNSVTKELSYSGQYKAFRHFAPFIKEKAKIHPLKFENNSDQGMFSYPKVGKPLEGVMLENTDGTEVLILVNQNEGKRQAQYFKDNKWWYIELLPNSVSTVVFEQN